MEVSFPINKLLKNGLTADDYTICALLSEKKYGLLKDYATLKGMSFYDNVKKLKEHGYIHYNTISDIVPVKEITVTKDYNKLISFKDFFTELYNEYPIKVARPDGKVDLLRVHKAKCRIKYTRVINKNPMTHEHIIDCLRHEIKLKEKDGSMGYFKRLYNWLETKEWEKYEDEVHTITENIPLN